VPTSRCAAASRLRLKPAIDEALAQEGCGPCARWSCTGAPRKDRLERDRDVWLHELMANQPASCEPEWVGAEHPLFVSVHVRFDRQTERRPALDRRLSAVGDADDEMDLRYQTIGRVLVHGRRGLGHRTHVRVLRPLATGTTEIVFEGVPTYPDPGRFCAHVSGPQGECLLHRTDRNPLADQGQRGGPRPRTPPSTTCAACGSWERWASRSTRKRGCGTTAMSAPRAHHALGAPISPDSPFCVQTCKLGLNFHAADARSISRGLAHWLARFTPGGSGIISGASL